MQQINDWLAGKKTILSAAGYAVAIFLLKAGFISQSDFEVLTAALTGLVAIFLRRAINKVEPFI